MRKRPARCVRLLFVPGDSDRKLAKSFDSGADALLAHILEDSSLGAIKSEARTTTRDFLNGTARTKAKRPSPHVRSSPADLAMVDTDLEAVITCLPD